MSPKLIMTTNFVHTFFMMPVFLLLKVVYLLSLFSMNSILILTLPFVFFPGLGPSLVCGSLAFLISESLSLSESRPASPLDLFMPGDSTTKGPLRAAGDSSTNCMVFILIFHSYFSIYKLQGTRVTAMKVQCKLIHLLVCTTIRIRA